MRKEIILAILLGLVIGLIVTYGIYQSYLSKEKIKQVENTELETSPTPAPSVIGDLILLSPEDETITDQEAITIAGSTQADNFVVILVNDQDLITHSDSSGNFSVETKLETGSNVILVSSIDEDGNQTSLERTVIYSTIALSESAEKQDE